MEMSANRWILLCVLFNAVFKGNALTCYVCEATKANVCKEGRAQLREVNCGLENNNFFWFCLYKVVYDVRRHKSIYSYSCEKLGNPNVRKESLPCDYKLPPGPMVFTNIPQCNSNKRYIIKQCKACNTDLCIANTTTNFSFRINSNDMYYIVMLHIIYSLF